MKGIKHLVQCHCVLPQYRRETKPIFHKFVVFSILDEENDKIDNRLVQCENCGTIHKIIDVCKSEIIPGKDESNTVITVLDVKTSIPEKLSKILENNNCDISTWEHAQFVFENELWEEDIIISKETLGDSTSLKILNIKNENKYKIKTINRTDVI